MIVISIALSDIPKDAIKAHENGKKYASFVIDERKEADKFGNTHSVAISQTQEQRQAKANKVYVGNGKEYVFGSKKPDYVQLPDQPVDDGLPF